MILKDEADGAIAEVGQLRLRQGEGVLVAEADAAVRRPVERAEDVQQRTFAGAGRPHHGHGLAALDFEIHVAQHGKRTGRSGIVFIEVFDAKRHEQ